MTEERDLATPAEPEFRTRIRVKETAPSMPVAPPTLLAGEWTRYGLTEKRAKDLRQLGRAVAGLLPPNEVAYLIRVMGGGKAEAGAEAMPKRGPGRPPKTIQVTELPKRGRGRPRKTTTERP